MSETRTPLRITLPMLKGACKEQRAIFRREWPGGADLTLENVVRAQEIELDLSWGKRWMTAKARADYQRQVAPLWADYERQVAPLWADYERQVAPLRADYQRQVAPLWADYERQIAPLRADYERQVALLWADYERQMAPLWLDAVRRSLEASDEWHALTFCGCSRAERRL